MDVCKICDSEKSGTDHQFPKDHGTALQQTAGDIQNGFRGAEDPGAQDPNLTFETQTLCGQPVLYVKHKQPVQKVCIYVVGNDLGDVDFDFEDSVMENPPFFDYGKGRQHFLLSPLDYPPARTDGAVNGGRSPFTCR